MQYAKRFLISVCDSFVSTMLIFAIAIFVGMLMAACSETSQQAQKHYLEMHFDLSQCKPIAQNVYKCPAIDKPVCGPLYANIGNSAYECLALDKNGNVLVERE